MKILKFGGSSVASPDTIRQVAAIVESYYEAGERFGVVVSAMGGVTDALLELADRAASGSDFTEKLDALRVRHLDAATGLLDGDRLRHTREKFERRFAKLDNILQAVQAIRELTARTKDYIVSFGERNSAFLLSQFLASKGLQAPYLDAANVVITDDRFGGARVRKEDTYARIQAWMAQFPGIPVITGFLGATEDGIRTTLGRGGSDYTAALFGAALDAELIEIWTDVNGILTADPRDVPDARSLKQVTYAEAMEMSHFGAKVIYPPTIRPALEADIPIVIKNTFQPGFEGTRISSVKAPNGQLITGIASIDKVVLLTLRGTGMIGVPGFAARLFSALSAEGVNIIMITQGSSEHAISFAVSPADALPAKAAVDKAFELEIERGIVEPVKMEDDLCIIAIIGESIKNRHNIAGMLFRALGANGVNVVAIAQGSSELIISVVLDRADKRKAVNAVHEMFFSDAITRVHLFVVGTGLVGKELLRQIEAQNPTLIRDHALEIKLCGIANSRRMYFDASGMPIADWPTLLDQGDKSDLAAFVTAMSEMNLRNSVFVDCTAGDRVPAFYGHVLDHSISISTPNKVAASGPLLRFRRLKQLARANNVSYLYETNVGAALPLIATIRDLVRSGDTILKIEGVLSGTLSYIFGAYTADKRFADVVREAKALGFTEPDPREDLKGLDVARKIVILAREAGAAMELSDVESDPILPDACLHAPNVEAFFAELEAAESFFAGHRDAAAQNGCVLRMLATYQDGHCRIGLQEVDASSPFYGLTGGDNMVAITSKRYHTHPLIVRGPGAGAEVTAAGVFAEIITIAKGR